MQRCQRLINIFSVQEAAIKHCFPAVTESSAIREVIDVMELAAATTQGMKCSVVGIIVVWNNQSCIHAHKYHFPNSNRLRFRCEFVHLRANV